MCGSNSTGWQRTPLPRLPSSIFRPMPCLHVVKFAIGQQVPVPRYLKINLKAIMIVGALHIGSRAVLIALNPQCSFPQFLMKSASIHGPLPHLFLAFDRFPSTHSRKLICLSILPTLRRCQRCSSKEVPVKFQPLTPLVSPLNSTVQNRNPASLHWYPTAFSWNKRTVFSRKSSHARSLFYVETRDFFQVCFSEFKQNFALFYILKKETFEVVPLICYNQADFIG